MATGRVPTTANSPLTAKGDLFTYSTAPARLAVGTNGDTIVADSSTATGLRYQTGVSLNCVTNGAMDIWQRGTSSTGLGTAKTFLADRWYANSANAATTFGYTQSTSVTTGFQYAAKIQRTASNTGTNAIYFQQDIETSNSIPFAGQTVTISLYAKAGANFSSASNALSVNLVSGTGTDQSQYFAFLTGQATVASGTATLTTSYQRFTFTGTVSSSATQLGISINYTPVGTAGADDSFFVTGVQVERGSVATTFKRTGGSIQGELAAAQRYYTRFSNDSAFDFFASGLFSSTTQGRSIFPLPVQMRVSPTTLDTGGAFALSNGVVSLTATSPTIGTVTPNAATISWAVTGATASQPCLLISDNNATTYVGLSSEL